MNISENEREKAHTVAMQMLEQMHKNGLTLKEARLTLNWLNIYFNETVEAACESVKLPEIAPAKI